LLCDRSGTRKRGAFKVEITAYIVLIIIGLITGSFLNVCISRIPEEGSIIYPPSRCPKCKTKIKIYDLIPVISYFILRGRCRHCGERISIRYPIVEALTALLFVLFYIKCGISVQFAAFLILSILLILISFIDIEHLMIPDFLMLTGIAGGLAYSIYNRSLTDSLIGMCFGFLFMFIMAEGGKYFLKKEALGDGDVKLMVMLGAFLGIERTILLLVVGSIAGVAVSLLAVRLGRLKMEDYIPFAPFLALGAVVSIFIR
jgi:leader peptidase (prepilin peptidase)/N-methyltransferase